jgi:HAD superfamily hydrolase (TIGR01490 family)
VAGEEAGGPQRGVGEAAAEPAAAAERGAGEVVGEAAAAAERGAGEAVGEPAAASDRGAAFFDLDRTLMAASAYEFARAAYRNGLLSRRQLASGAWANLQFRLRGSTDVATDELRERIAGAIEGVRVRDLQRLGPDVLAGVLPRVYPQMLHVAWEHQDAGRRIYICTAAAHELAEVLAFVLGFDGGIGARSEVRDGVYTGRPHGPFTYREGKAQAMREVAGEAGIDLGASWAYSDSESDLPMLRAVGHPVAVNPDATLARIAREEGWEVLCFERLGRRLVLAGSALVATAAGGIGSVALARRRSAPAGRARTRWLR